MQKKKFKYFKFLKQDNSNSITISKLTKEKVIKRDNINKENKIKDKQKNDNLSNYNNVIEKKFESSNSKINSEGQSQINVKSNDSNK